ncbi:MAG: DUF5309 domain-containing protein [Muribaculaceae bacterium]|nr:DUF5309 domain-containing protein [Muribaculaceae bacterium]
MSTQTLSGPVTVATTNELAPGLIRNAIDQRIVKIRPMSTPIDQISRYAGARQARSMMVEYYSVDPKKSETTVESDVPSGNGSKRADGVYTHVIKTQNDLIFEPTETVMFPDITTKSGETLVAYVVSRIPASGIEIMVINGNGDTHAIPSIPSGSKIIRMGRAASELDVQTAQFQALPVKRANNCQIFKMQVEESTLHKIANKEVGWSFSDNEEAAIIDMRLGMEKNFLFGSKRVLRDPIKNEDVYLTGGIWHQAPDNYLLDLDVITEKDLIDLTRKAFTGTCGTKQKMLVCGSELMSALSKIECKNVRYAHNPNVKWGLTFSELQSNFGTLRIIHSEVFDQCGHECDGMVIDPDYLTKYVHIPFHAEQLDLRRSGQRNTSAVVITEASCLVLRYPDTHLKVIGFKAPKA